MSTRNLEKLFAPRSVALIGASERAHTVGAVTLKNLRSSGFGGELFLVNPAHEMLAGLKVYPGVAGLPATPDLAVITTPADQVVKVIHELGARGTKAAVVITAGFAELGERGGDLQRDMLAAAEPYDLRIVGPNCIGVIVPGIGLNASFAQVSPPKGDIALISQSGAMVTAMLDWAQPRGIGFSHVVSLGDMADVDFGDVIEYLNDDAATHAIALYIEGIAHAQKFVAAARSAARAKTLLALKVGRRTEGAKAAHSHTGALAGSDIVYDAAFRRAGILRVANMAGIFDAIETLALTHPVSGDRLAILTNGGGPGVVAVDALAEAGGDLAALAPTTFAQLDALLPATWSHANPVDMIGDAPAERYSKALAVLLEDEESDAVLVINCPTALADSADAARAVIATVNGAAPNPVRKSVFTAWLGEYLAAPARALFAEARIATYETPDDAVQGFMDRVAYRRSQAVLAEDPPLVSSDPEVTAVSAIFEGALSEGRKWLEAPEVAAVLSAYGIPALRVRAVNDSDSAAAAAEAIGGPVALKIRSQDLTHKSDVGGVALNLSGARRVRDEALAMLARVKSAKPDARVDGFLVQEMALRPGTIELIVGMSVDSVFGPVVLFGRGGTAVELIGDTALELPPLNLALARAQMSRTRVWRLLQGYRNTPPADLDAIAGVLVKVAQLAVDYPAISELDINPLLADPSGVLSVDARIGVTKESRVPLAMAPGLREALTAR